MKTLLLIFALSMINAFGSNVIPLPALGAGDSKILVWLTEDLGQFYIFRYVGRDPLPEGMSFSTNNFAPNTLELIYPERAGAIFDLRLHHFFPLGNGQGFVRRIGFVQRHPERGENQTGLTSEIYKEVTYDAVFEEKGGVLVASALTTESEESEFGLKSGRRFLGKLDGIVFYWNEEEKESIFGRDTKSGRVLRWNVPRMLDVEGVLRGNKKAYGFIVSRRFRVPHFTNASEDNSMVEVSTNDATILILPKQPTKPTLGAVH